jgi:uncharacterized protein (DUF3084 family)
MSGDELATVESGLPNEPVYDTSTHTVTEPDGEKREAFVHEDVRAALQQHRADRDPVERYRQKAEKNGHKIEQILQRVEEFDNLQDPIEKLRWVNRLHGIDDQTAAQYLYHGQPNVQVLFRKPSPHLTGAITTL